MAGNIKNCSDVYVMPGNISTVYKSDSERNTTGQTRTPQKHSKGSNSTKTTKTEQNEWIYTTGPYEANFSQSQNDCEDNSAQETAPKVIQDNETRKSIKKANNGIKKNNIKSWVAISIALLAVILFVGIALLYFM